MNLLRELFSILYEILEVIAQNVWLYYLINIIIFYVIFHALRILLILLINKRLSHKSKKWHTEEEKPRKILIIGDSTAVGTGASRAEDTIAGRLAHDFPNHQIVNLGKNGGLIRDLSEQIERVKNMKFELIIISAGGNDVWHLSRKKTIATHLSHTLTIANEISNKRVFFLIYNNIGDAPLFPGILRNFLRKRCVSIQSYIEMLCLENETNVIPLFNNKENNPFLKTPITLFAEDGIHPSSEGYNVWYNRMWRILVANGFRLSQQDSTQPLRKKISS
jgi:lysophospholipase L1-like esterase